MIIGAGFGGYFAARRLARKLHPSEARITVVSDNDGLLYQPLLPEVAVGALDPRTILVPLATSLAAVELVRGRVTGFDFDAKTLSVVNSGGEQQQLAYDRLVLAPGAVTRTLDIPGLASNALGFKTVGQALYLRDLVLRRMEQANGESRSGANRVPLTFIVVGAGYAGTELVAQMSRMTARIIPSLFDLRAEDVRWMLLDMASAVMPELGADLGSAALDVLRGRDVDVRLKTSISEISDHEVTLTDGTKVTNATVVWCAGVTPNPLIAATGLPVTKGRLDVDADLRVPGREDVYALGDAAAVPDSTAKPDSTGTYPLCPPTAQHAMRQGHAAARNVIADVRGVPRRAYRHHDLGLVVDLGGTDAVARPLGVPIRGRLAKIVARGYHLYALPTGRRRTRAVLDWLTAGRTPDDVAIGLLNAPEALASAEHVTDHVPESR